MKYSGFFMIIIALISVANFSAQQYQPVDKESKIVFTAENFGIDVEGSLSRLTGTIIFDPADLAACVFTVSVDAKTVNTGNTTRDRHLKGTDFLNTDQYSAIRFVSTSITKTQQGFTITGLITIKGITKSVSFPFITRIQNTDIVFSGQFGIDRKDFDIGGGLTVGRTVKIRITVLARQ